MALSLRRVDPTPATLAIGGSDLDWDLANIFAKSISIATTFTFSNTPDGKIIIFKISNTSASSVTVSWPSSVVSSDNTIGANKTKIYTFVSSGTSIYASSLEF